MARSWLRRNSLGSKTYLGSKGQEIREAKAQNTLVVQTCGEFASENKVK